MYKTEDILARLQNGEDVDTIAREFTDALNAAKNQHEVETKAKIVADELRKNKVADMEDILDLIYEYVNAYYCENESDLKALNDAFDDITAEGIVDGLDELGSVVVKVAELENKFPSFGFALGKTKEMPSLGDIFGDIFKMI